MSESRRILVTGATGYIGGRLVPRLLDKEYRIRVLVRDGSRLKGRQWLDQVESVVGDVERSDSLAPAMQEIDAAYYLIHGLYTGANFHQRDIAAARNFGAEAKEAGVQRIIYLGGLGDSASKLSVHLRSRQDTGDALRESGVPVTEFRAAVIVGSGSASFEMIRYLTDRLPVMVCPRWVYTLIQPIAINDVLGYLVAALDRGESIGRIIEIGGADVLTYADTMLRYAKVRGLRRFLLPVPVLSPTLSSHWVHWVTPVSAQIARPLIEGLKNETVVRDDSSHRIFPDIQPMGYEDAVEDALSGLHAGKIESTWTDALISSHIKSSVETLSIQEGIIVKRWQRMVRASPQMIFRVFSGLGGQRGWFYANWIWKLRGLVDRLAGGSGLRRGRRDPDELRVGDAVDFWRVETVEPWKTLRLRSEMRQPGSLWLQYETIPDQKHRSQLIQTIFYAPKGLFGLAYWYVFYVFHHMVFSGVVRRIAKKAEKIHETVEPPSQVS